MKDFAQLVTELDQTTKTNAKIAALVRYLDQASDRDKLWAIALFSGRRPRRAVKTTLLRLWASELFGVPLWLVEESYHIVGDLAETLGLLLPGPVEDRQSRSLSEWMAYLAQLRSLEEEEKREHITQAWHQLNSRERFVFNKLITGGFRLGVSQRLLVRALAKQTGRDVNVLAHRLMGNWHPVEADYEELILAENARDDHSRPYPFYLAYALDREIAELGDPATWQAEWKWDGIRSQLIHRQGEWFLWSRGEELITDKFPELADMALALPEGTVIDGELLPFREERPLSFHLLQTRIGRKRVTAKVLANCPVVIMAYDLMEYGGEDIRAWPMERRREKLAEIVANLKRPYDLRLSPLAQFQDWQELTQLRTQARDHYSEGLMLKRRDSDYKVGRKRGDWWKWKVDPLSIDAVMIYAQRGHGRRANLYSDYTFAVWKEDELVPFAKAYSGLTDAEMRQVDTFVKRNTLERFGPVRRVKPELVFEIGFEGINRSTRHKSGVALRFPRMLRWRTDKKPEEANTLMDLEEILAQYG
jgi:DNA ligase-1